MNTGSSSKIPVLHPEAVIREEFDDWALLFDPDTGNTFGMNPTTVLIVRTIDGKRTISDIVHTISEKFEEVPDSVADDVENLLNGLIATGMVSWRED